jgi:DNA (cytosine-5)-methyltransferase 1
MIRNQLILDIHKELIIDNFAGGGGASCGIEMGLGRHVDIAVNHNAAALAMHEINHPQTEHLREDVFKVNPKLVTKGRPVGLAWFSPDCTHFSKAKGSKPRSKKIRGLAWVMVKWGATVAPRVMILENVEEFQEWGPLLPNRMPCPKRKGWTFKSFVKRLRAIGYEVEWREIRACIYGAPTIRKRLFLIARRDGNPIVWPEAHFLPPADPNFRKGFHEPERIAAQCIDFARYCPSIFMKGKEVKELKLNIKRPLVENSERRIAKGVWRYTMNTDHPFIVCLTHHGSERTESIAEPWKTVTGAHRGEKAFVQPYVTYAQQGGRSRPINKPIHTITASTKDQNQVIMPFLARTCYKGANGSYVNSALEPFRTLTTQKDGYSIVSAHVARQFGESVGSDVGKPIGTVTAGGGGKSQVIAAHVARCFGTTTGHPVTEPMKSVMPRGGGGKNEVISTFLAQQNTGSVGHGTGEPMSTICGRGTNQALISVSLLKYFGTDQDPQMRQPLGTITTKHRFGLTEAAISIPPMTPDLAIKARRVARFLRKYGIEFDGEFATTRSGLIIYDIGMRMFEPFELFLAQGFPPWYIIDFIYRGKPLTRTEQIRMCGNSVPPPFAEYLSRANVPDLGVKFGDEKKANL